MKKCLLALSMLLLTGLCFSTETTDTGKLIAYATADKPAPAAVDLVQAGYTHIIVAYGVLSTITPGQIIPAFSSTITPEYIQSLQAAGIKVLLSLGGASTNIVNTTTDFHEVLEMVSDPQCFIEEMVNSMEDMLRQYHFDGFDIDFEHGVLASGRFEHPTGDIAVLSSILHWVRSKHPQILLSLSPKMSDIGVTKNFTGYAGNYAALVMQTAPILSWVGIQAYDCGPGIGLDGIQYRLDDPNNPDVYVAMASSLLENWPAKDRTGHITGWQPYLSYLKPSQLVVGFPVVNRSGVSDGEPSASIATVKRTVNCLRSAQSGVNSCRYYAPPRAYPNFGGVFVWDLAYDQDNEYRFARSLRNCVILNQCD